jgi:hypothetical protein
MPAPIIHSTLDRTTGLPAMLAPDVNLYCPPDSFLRVSVYNATSSVVVAISGLFMDICGEVRPFLHLLTPTTDRVVTNAYIPLGEGWLRSVSPYLNAGAPKRGTCHVGLDLQIGDSSGGQLVQRLLRGYLHAATPLGWPHGAMLGPLEGPGALRVITGSVPAAGAEVSETVPAGVRWRLRSLRLTLVTDGNAANRMPVLTFDDGTSVFLSSSAQIQAASLTWVHMFMPGAGAEDATAITSIVNLLPPEIWLGAGYRIKTLTTAIQATDAYAAPIYQVEEWIEA